MASTRAEVLRSDSPPGQGSNKSRVLKHPKHPKLFPCTDCPSRYTTANNMRAHMRGHTGERPFVCSNCDRRFARQNDRKRHEQSHSGERRCIKPLLDNPLEASPHVIKFLDVATVAQRRLANSVGTDPYTRPAVFTRPVVARKIAQMDDDDSNQTRPTHAPDNVHEVTAKQQLHGYDQAPGSIKNRQHFATTDSIDWQAWDKLFPLVAGSEHWRSEAKDKGAFPHDDGYRTHRRRSSDSNISTPSHGTSPDTGTIGCPSADAHSSLPVLNTHGSTSNLAPPWRLQDLTEDQLLRRNDISAGHSPSHSPMIILQHSQALPPYTHGSNYELVTNTNEEHLQQPHNGLDIFQAQGLDVFPSTRHTRHDDLGAADQMSPPENRIEYAPPSSSVESARPIIAQQKISISAAVSSADQMDGLREANAELCARLRMLINMVGSSKDTSLKRKIVSELSARQTLTQYLE
ncbi:DNA-binding transcription factor [Elasticomyces elasticus]|nr:DNA-binding transcription factor [Elasticomyces elasticus]